MEICRDLVNDAFIILAITRRELAFRYRKSIIGLGWVLMNPLLTSFTLWIIFANRFGAELSPGQKYAPFLVAGTLAQTFFSQSLVSSMNSVADNGNLLGKFPVKPDLFILGYVLSSLTSFLAGLFPLALACFLSGQKIAATAPLAIISGLVLSILISGLSMLLVPMTMKIQDLRNVISFLASLMVFITPVFYPANTLPTKLQFIVNINPLTGIVDFLRWSFSNNAEFNLALFIYPIILAVAIFIVGRKLIRNNWGRLVHLL